MELPELPEGLEVHLSKSKVALKPLVRLITSVNEGLSEKAVHFFEDTAPKESCQSGRRTPLADCACELICGEVH
ncbi:hypothetical protein MRX96_002338 [Rhipicephalus microplus]